MDSNNAPVNIPYTLQPGDTLENLADQYNTTVEDIIDANPELDPSNLQAGQEIRFGGGFRGGGFRGGGFRGGGFRGFRGFRGFDGFRRPFFPYYHRHYYDGYYPYAYPYPIPYPIYPYPYPYPYPYYNYDFD